MAVLALRALRAEERRSSVPPALANEDRTASGPFDLYFTRIAELATGPIKSFFVIAQAIGQPHFVQVSVGGPPNARRYQFDIPVTGWSKAYAEKIEAEARRRGLTPVRVDGGPISFLDIDFNDHQAHANFARWVVREVFGLPEGIRFEITWGEH